MTARLEDLLNIGPATAAMLREVGIGDPAALRAAGAVAAFGRLRFRFPRRVSLNALWALHGALEGLPWNALDRQEKARLKGLLPR